MPLLSVHCVVTHHDGLVQRSRRAAWIEARDFPQLVLAATAQLRLPPCRCEYKLFAPDVGKAFVGVLLEVAHDGLSALVGPMGGPAVPAVLAGERTCTFDELIASTGLDAEAPGRRIYPVTVVYADFLGADSLGTGLPTSGVPEAGFPGVVRGPRKSGADYRTRCAAAERVRLERGRHEGFHALPYDVPVDAWRAEDLEALIARAYALLPAHEPRWRESGVITHEPTFSAEAPGATPVDTASRASRCVLEVQRGDFVAHLRLPAFPVSALADWLARRPCEISLRQPMKMRPVLVRERPLEEVADLALAR
jgi:hypothetical protein